MVNLDRCNGNCNTFDDPPARVYVPNKHFYYDTKINEFKTLTKHISCGCRCNFDGTKSNSNQKWNRE